MALRILVQPQRHFDLGGGIIIHGHLLGWSERLCEATTLRPGDEFMGQLVDITCERCLDVLNVRVDRLCLDEE